MTKFKYLISSLMVFLLLGLTAYVGYRLAFRNLIFPKVSISGIDVTGMDRDSALKLVKSYFEADPNDVILTFSGKEVGKLKGLAVTNDPVWAVDQAVGIGRNGNILTQLTEQVQTLTKGREVNVPISFDKEELDDLVGQVQDKINQEPTWPKLVKDKNEYVLENGKNGIGVVADELTKEIIRQLAYPGKHQIEVPTNIISTAANQNMVNSAKAALSKWGEKELKIRSREYETVLRTDEMVKYFGLTSDLINKSTFGDLVNEIKTKVESEPADAVFVFENNKVQEFKPEVVGAQIDIPAFENKLAEVLLKGEGEVLEIPMILSYPKVKAGDINDLGIKELIGSGKSTFSHSIPGRVFNVNLAASRVNGTLVAPGEEFSFNNAVGEISKATGYQSAYIISAGRTVLGDGGGVCQVSTTTFRAALDAGLPITERKAHAYRVGYYEQDSPPGIDATVFSPTADLKFLNDTGNYILIQETVDTKNMTMRVDIYGTSDGRKATITKPRISSQTPPPATLYVDDPTLPAGTMKQVDWSAWGAKVAFDYKVERNGEIVYEKTFVSNYQPWQAIYLKGTGDVASR